MMRNSSRRSSEKYDQVYSQCSLIEKGGKSEIDCNSSDGDCNCFQEDGTGCMFGLCVCLYKEHLVFDHMNCNEIQHLNHYENDTVSNSFSLFKLTMYDQVVFKHLRSPREKLKQNILHHEDFGINLNETILLLT